MSEHGYKQALNCEERARQHRFRMEEVKNEIDQITVRLQKLLSTVGRLGYDLEILTRNSCCSDPDCPNCRDYPEKQQLKNCCNVTVDLRRDCVEAAHWNRVLDGLGPEK